MVDPYGNVHIEVDGTDVTEPVEERDGEGGAKSAERVERPTESNRKSLARDLSGTEIRRKR